MASTTDGHAMGVRVVSSGTGKNVHLAFDTMFEPRAFKFESMDSELVAVAERRKGLAWYPMSCDQLYTYSDHDELVEQATRLGLTVVTRPRDENEVVRSEAPTVDVFALPPNESWRVETFIACNQTLGRYRWSDASEYLSSFLLGYSEQDCRSWIQECRYNRLGWTGQTVYSVLTASERELLHPLSFRCFPMNFDSASLIAIAHPDAHVLRRECGSSLPNDLTLCRFALKNSFYLQLYEAVKPDDSGMIATALGVRPTVLNAALESNIELWVSGQWQRTVDANG